jgi:imidazole glycerol-phosphate synthase subunit HisH
LIVVVDYGRGNLFSLGQALRQFGIPHELTDSPAKIAAAAALILPGVGAFGDVMAGLVARDLVAPIKAAIARGVPFLGICVGCQVLLDAGEEFGWRAGLGVIPGTVPRLPAPRADDPDAIRIPNVGWRPLLVRPGEPLFAGAGPLPMVYFVHSYAPRVADERYAVAHIAINGASVPAAIRKDNVVGVQFHPEKSGRVGLAILRNFVEHSLVPA